MARRCEVCGKGPRVGRSIIRRGKSKKEGGIGLNITGITKRRFLPNLRRLKVKNRKGSVFTIKICSRCLRTHQGLHKAGLSLAPSPGRANPMSLGSTVTPRPR